MRSFKLGLLLSLVCLFSFSVPAFAHEFIIKPDNFSPKSGEEIKVEVQAAHVFMESEEAEPLEDVAVYLLQDKKETPISFKESKDGHSLVGTFKLPEDGAAILVGHRTRDIVSKTTEGFLDGGRKELEAQGKTVLSVNKYEKYAKTFLNTQVKSEMFSRALGQELEIVPVSDLSMLKVGDYLEAKLLYKGKALRSPVWATYDGFTKESNTYAYYTESEKDTFKVKITHPGIWMIRSEHTAKQTGKDAENHVLRTVLVFEVR
ncbi:DUF4198 domain-containing protein [Desulfovibrio litoralis]|uniref:Uncharacterized conserved protein, contains GH25 family domain n=1 Tax=Desulfovibrio litoralis DSM 11393 TaxID=1121455 RepID=A0A1M7S6L9_9BACT|nr:DUF4198 domain-containing protein [Desulfovibrio litoralis]SHN54024.1 Uncharacterized conserved protein, contains GH25 family domain [Desulfovibrio litoralis DSM 11393]